MSDRKHKHQEIVRTFLARLGRILCCVCLLVAQALALARPFSSGLRAVLSIVLAPRANADSRYHAARWRGLVVKMKLKGQKVECVRRRIKK